MLRLSKLTDYAIAVLARLGQEGGLRTAPELAAGTGLGEPTVSKVLKTLGHACLVEGGRGSRGGYRLARPLSRISLAEVVVAMDGPIALTACVDGSASSCDAEALCPVRGRWNPVNEAIRDALASVSLADLTANPCQSHGRTAPTAPPAVPVAAQ